MRAWLCSIIKAVEALLEMINLICSKLTCPKAATKTLQNSSVFSTLCQVHQGSMTEVIIEDMQTSL